MDFEQEFKKQLKFLDSSLSNYTTGDYDEAARLATCLRVIFHHTENSRSLIDYLGWWDKEIISTIPDLSGIVMRGLSFSLPLAYEQDGQPKVFEKYTVPDWWEQKIVLKEDISPTRGQIIKWTANKDGGTHCDPNQPAAYQHVKKVVRFRRVKDDSEEDSLAQRFIGHFSYEVLQSFS
jgi:hypothetical protein